MHIIKYYGYNNIGGLDLIDGGLILWSYRCGQGTSKTKGRLKYVHCKEYKATVSCKRVSGHIKADKTCGRAVIIIHYSIILPQHFLYIFNISCSYQRQEAWINSGNCTEHAQCIIMTIMAK